MDPPLIDEHCVDVGASPTIVWASAVEVVPRAFSGRSKQLFARAVGCDEAASGGPRPLDSGSTFPGFRVADARPPHLLDLAGRHRFSRYALTFRIHSAGSEHARVCAVTRAEFFGLSGAVYRSLVIGTGLHVVVVRRILGAIKRRAEATSAGHPP